MGGREGGGKDWTSSWLKQRNWRRPITHPRRLLHRLRCKVLLNAEPPTPTPSRSAAPDEKSRVIDDRDLVFHDRNGWGNFRGISAFAVEKRKIPDSRGKVKWIVVLFALYVFLRCWFMRDTAREFFSGSCWVWIDQLFNVRTERNCFVRDYFWWMKFNYLFLILIIFVELYQATILYQ